MTKGKFVQLLQTLEKKELKAFSNYLHGNYGAKTQLLLIYEYVLKFVKKHQFTQLQKELTHKNYFIAKGIAPVVVNNRLSDLNQLLMEFLLWQKVKKEKDRIEIKKIELEILKERQLTNRFHQEIKKTIQSFEQQQSSWQDLNLLYLHELNAYNADGNQHKENRLAAAMRHLDNFYATFKLKYAIDLLGRNKILNETNEVWLLKEIMAYARKKETTQKSHLSLYSLTVQLLHKEEWSTFLKLEQHLYKFHSEDKKEQLMLLITLTNYLVKRFRSGHLEVSDKIFELYDFGLKENIMIADKTFPPIPFKNILSIACILTKLDWAKAFVEKWAAMLPVSFRTDGYYYGKGAIAFAEKHYEKSLLHLQEVNLQNHFYSTNARTLIIRAHFELGNLPSAASACDAFEKYLRTHKRLNEHHITAGLNFIKLMRLFIKKTPPEKIELVLKKVAIVQSKLWFVEKLKN